MDTQDPLVSLDFKPSCDARRAEAQYDHPAEYVVKCRHCGHVVLLCRNSLATARQAAQALHANLARRQECCGHEVKATGRAPQLDDLYLVERLDK
jgi:hypothetical protein